MITITLTPREARAVAAALDSVGYSDEDAMDVLLKPKAVRALRRAQEKLLAVMKKAGEDSRRQDDA